MSAGERNDSCMFSQIFLQIYTRDPRHSRLYSQRHAPAVPKRVLWQSNSKSGGAASDLFVVVFEYGAKNHGDGSGCYNTDACILAMVVGKESRLLEKKLWCAVVGCSGTDSARVREIDVGTLGGEGTVRGCEISNFVTG